MLTDATIFIASLLLLIKGATMSTRYASHLAETFRLSKYTVGFIIVAVISILPETFIGINSSLSGVPDFGLGVLLGSNVADLTLVFALVTFFSRKGLKIESKILRNHKVYPFILLLPLVLGLNSHFSRPEGLALILAGGIFYYQAFKNGENAKKALNDGHNRVASLFLLILSMALMLTGAHFTVYAATNLAEEIGVSPVLIGMLIVGLGTTMPELVFSLKSVQKRGYSLAVGDILGTVLADATIVVGILALIHPFSFPTKIVYVSGAFMVVASLVLFRLMKTGKRLSKPEAFILVGFWLIFVMVEFLTQ